MIGKMVFALVAAVGLFSTNVMADCTSDRPGLLKAADVLMEDMETFDEALHEVKAEEKIIGLVHHFEEGLLEFMEELRTGASCKQAIDEFQHFHEDIQLTYRALDARPDIFYAGNVLNTWNRLLPSFVRFQNRLYWY